MHLPPGGAKLDSLSCGGVPISVNGPGSELPRVRRALLQSVSLAWAEVTAVLTLAGTDAGVPAGSGARVQPLSSGILVGPMSEFFGASTLLIRARPLLAGQSVDTGAVMKPEAGVWEREGPPTLDDTFAVPPAVTEPAPTAAVPVGVGASTAGEPWPSNDMDPAGARPSTMAPSTSSATKATKPPRSKTQTPLAAAAAPAAPAAHGEAAPVAVADASPPEMPVGSLQAVPMPVATVAATEPSELELSTFPWRLLAQGGWDLAPSCAFAPTRNNSVTDARGRLWSLMHGGECVFRSQPGLHYIPTSDFIWETAPLCIAAPNRYNAVLDTRGKLWGWQAQRSCAFRSASTLAVADAASGAQSLPALWEDAPVCALAPTASNTSADVFGRLWGKESGMFCAYKV